MLECVRNGVGQGYERKGMGWGGVGKERGYQTGNNPSQMYPKRHTDNIDNTDRVLDDGYCCNYYKMSQNQNQLPLIRKKLEWKKSRNDIVLSKYDPFKYPADLEAAQNHRLAKRTCKVEINSDGERCQCCMLPIQNQLIPYNCQLQQFSHLGLAYPLYFVFIKLCTALLIIQFVCLGIAQLTLNLLGTQCSSLQIQTRICRLSFINSLNLSKLSVNKIQTVSNLLFTLFLIILVEFIKYKSNSFKIKVQKNEKSPADYSILIKGLPKDITLYELQHFATQELERLNLDSTLVKIYLIYDVMEYLALYTKKREIYQHKCQLTDKYEQMTKKSSETTNANKRNNYLRKADNIFEEISETENTYETIEAEIERYQESFRIIVENLKKDSTIEQLEIPKHVKFSGKCIITLNSALSAKTLTNHYKLTCREGIIYKLQELFKLDSSYGKFYKGHIIKISRAPDPTDIIFANMGSHKILQIKQRIMVSFIIASLVLLTFIILAFGKKLFNQSKATSRNPLVWSFYASLSVAFFNSILGRLVRYFSLDEKYSKQSSYYYYVARRITIVYLGNMIITTILANVASFYLIGEPSASTYPGISLNFVGLVNDFFFINASNSFIGIFFTFLDYRYVAKLIKKWYISNHKTVTQAEANLCYENQHIDMALKYSHAFRLLLFTAAVSPLIPNALMISIGVMVIIYFVDKYLILRRLMCQFKLGYSLSAMMLRMLNWYPIFFSFSNLMLVSIPFSIVDDFSQIYFYFSLGVFLYTFFVQLFPTGLIQRILITFLKEKSQVVEQEQKYKNLQKGFIEDYSNIYPYFRVSVETESEESQSLSPRKNKLLDETNKKLSQSVFVVLRDYIDNRTFNSRG